MRITAAIGIGLFLIVGALLMEIFYQAYYKDVEVPAPGKTQMQDSLICSNLIEINTACIKTCKDINTVFYADAYTYGYPTKGSRLRMLESRLGELITLYNITAKPIPDEADSCNMPRRLNRYDHFQCKLMNHEPNQ